MEKTKTKSNKKLFIIVLVVLLLALAVGYAAFSDVLKISGTANAKGTFDLEFRNAKIVTSAGVRLNGDNPTSIEISGDKDALTVTAADLAYPGAGVEYSVDIYNNGSISADVTKVLYERLTGGNNFIVVEGLEQFDTTHKTLEPGDTCNIHFTVKWDKDATEDLPANPSVDYKLTLEYTQSTKNTTFTGNTSHTENTSRADA